MVNLIPVDPAEVGTQNRNSRRGRVSYPILKAFMESQHVVMKIDPTSTDKNPQYLRSVLTSYVKNHNLPVKIFSQEGVLHLARIDLDDEGNIDPDWKPIPEDERASEGSVGAKHGLTPVAITPDEVDRRAEDVAKKSHT